MNLNDFALYGLVFAGSALAAIWLLAKTRYWLGYDVSELPRIVQRDAKRQADGRAMTYLLVFMADLVAVVFSAGVLFGVFTGL